MYILYVFIDVKTYNLDVFQCLKCTNGYVFLFVSVHLYNFINKWFRFLDPLTYPLNKTYPFYKILYQK